MRDHNIIWRIKDLAQRVLHRFGYELKRYHLAQNHSDVAPLPPDSSEYLRQDNPRFSDLRKRYEKFNVPASVPGLWKTDYVNSNLQLQHFRGHSAYVWALRREGPEADQMRHYLYGHYIKSRDSRGLLGQLKEDALFGNWTYHFHSLPIVSRDLLDSINEIYFLDRHLHVFDRPGLRILDIGAGYGRLAHRMLSAVPSVDKYYCTDAIPASTFLSEYYLKFRGVADRAEVVPLDEFQLRIQPGEVQLAVNIHSFSECTQAAVRWWLEQLARLKVPYLLLVPNDRDELLSYESDGSKLPLMPVLESCGYRVLAKEDIYQDPDLASFMPLNDRIYLFERTN